jgi:arsenate reductase-like glutaredoxin family protein
VSNILEQLHNKKSEFRKINKELLVKQNMTEDHEHLVKLQEENALMKRRIISIKNKKVDTGGNSEEKTLQEELNKCTKAIQSDNNRTTFYIKRFDNTMKSILEAIQNTNQEFQKKEILNKELGKFSLLYFGG